MHAKLPKMQIKYNPFKNLHLGSIIEMDRVISESCYKGPILQRNYRKMTLWSFSYNFFVIFHGMKQFGSTWFILLVGR